jgi:hypothetical protein
MVNNHSVRPKQPQTQKSQATQTQKSQATHKVEYGKDGTVYVDSKVPRANMSDEHKQRQQKQNGAVGNAAIALFTAPARLMGWLTSNRGGKIMLGILAGYCAALSAESWYVTLPSLNGVQTSENRKFVPKPFINDGADLGLLNPLNALPTMWGAIMGVFESILPFQLKGATPAPVRCVWLDWRFYFAVVVSLCLQMWQARALRALTIEQRQRKAQDLQRYKRMRLDPQSIEIAQIKASEYNQSLMGKRRASGLMIFLSYATELGTGFSSISQSSGIGILTAGIYCIIQAFGFEVMYNQLQDND